MLFVNVYLPFMYNKHVFFTYVKMQNNVILEKVDLSEIVKSTD